MRLDNDLIRQIMLKLEKEGVNFNPKTAPKLECKEPVACVWGDYRKIIKF